MYVCRHGELCQEEEPEEERRRHKKLQVSTLKLISDFDHIWHYSGRILIVLANPYPS